MILEIPEDCKISHFNKMKNPVLFLDAGHGGRTPQGKYPTFPGKCHAFFVSQITADMRRFSVMEKGEIYLCEGIINRAVADLVLQGSLRFKFDVIPVFDWWEDTSLSSRAESANKYAEKEGVGTSIFISIHCNGSARHDVQGHEVFHYPGSKNGKRLANLFNQEWHKKYWFGEKNRGVKEEKDYAVLAKTTMPAILPELFFFDNYIDAINGCVPGNIQAAANTILKTAQRYFYAD